MPEHETTEARTLFDELPLAHIRVDIPVLDGDAVLGFSIRGVDINGAMIFQSSWSRGAFPTITQLAFQLALELENILERATATVD
jgi:hypothetical protein